MLCPNDGDIIRYESEIPNYKTWTAAKNLSILICKNRDTHPGRSNSPP